MKQIENPYVCEGGFLHTEENRFYTATVEGLRSAMENGVILEGRSFLCDSDRNLHVSVGSFRGVMPREECVYARDTEVKDIAIISRVGKPVCFRITDLQTGADGMPVPILSRREAQRECTHHFAEKLIAGDVIDAKVTHLDPFGAFCDIGCGLISLMPIDCMSVSRINHPRERFAVGQQIRAVIKHPADDDGRITLTHRELLGTWEENAARFEPGQTAAGIVRSVESYGIFVELAPNLAGLAECKADVRAGQHAAVYIKNILPQKMKVKLAIIDVCEGDGVMNSYQYPDIDHIDYWRYSPDGCEKLIETEF